ncbi:la protein homolog [Plutella xylostella]|uniref:la protein homolog n=1 Tax=Plutella xylostella TaxID=51655 RepID=UPI002032EB85|nr:la protein homolog [Plutella xylostella]
MTEKEVATESKNGEENEAANNVEEETALESSIIRQVEYYFGDANLPRDKFLREQVKLDDGWVPLDVLTRFNRLAKLTTDLEVIANALNKATSGLLEVSEDNKKVRRNPELLVPEMTEERRKELMTRTVYVKGFPKDATLDEMLSYFKTHGDVENVVMRRYLDRASKERKFKGSVFATFKVVEEAQKFLTLKDLKYKETELILRPQDEYLQEKQQEYLARKEKKDKKGKDGESKQEDKHEIKLPTGTVLKFSECHDKTTREDVKSALEPLGAEVAYIDFKVGDKDGWVRLTKEDSAKELHSKLTDGKLKIGDSEVLFTVLEGDEETEYLQRTVDEMSKRRKNQRNNKYQNRGGKGNYRGKGNYQNRKRKQDGHDDAPASKVKAD